MLKRTVAKSLTGMPIQLQTELQLNWLYGSIGNGFLILELGISTLKYLDR